jgi:hypothetical protein
MRCLALNASFEPLTMVPVRRALRLVIDGKAEVVEAEGAPVHLRTNGGAARRSSGWSASSTFLAASVARSQTIPVCPR